MASTLPAVNSAFNARTNARFAQVNVRPLQKTNSFVPIGLNLRKPLSVSTCRKMCVTQAAAVDFDSEKEESLKYRRVVFDFEKWANHRSTDRYWRHLSGMLGSRIVRGLTYPLLVEGLLATTLCVYAELYKTGQLPEYAPDLIVNISLPFGLSSFALSLLLAYRTSASYGRFDEARKFWGGVVNRSRDFIRQGTAWFDPVAEEEQVKMLGRWMTAFPWSMMCHLRTGEDLSKELKDKLTPAELEYLLSTPHRPNTVLQMLSKLVHTSSLPSDKKFRMDENLTLFADMLGASERILRTPIPVSYTRHTSRFLMMWLFFLPMSIYPQAGWGTIPASILIAFCLLAIEEIGVQIEEPFSVLPMEAISATITANINHHLNAELLIIDANKKAVDEVIATALPSTNGSAAPAAAPSGAAFIAKLEEQIVSPAPSAALATTQLDDTPAVRANGATNGAAGTRAPNGATPSAQEPVPVSVVAPAAAASESTSPGKPFQQRIKVEPSGVKLADVSTRPLSRFDRKLREYFDRKNQQ